MTETRPGHSSGESTLDTRPFADESARNYVTKLEVHFRLLTLRAAKREFGIGSDKIYAAVRDGVLHPVMPQGRTLYPEWELAALVASLTKSYSIAA